MGYKTTQGRTVDYPADIVALAAKSNNDATKAVAQKTYDLFRELQFLDSEVISLREENKRLKHENEFMYRLINERLNDV